ncbi:MAG TPA: hypothetical protein VFX25_20165 [Streptosporangiaceae bacterium]|nr:hypothetical protein [Streptosporangiaceae bacterium]
MNPALPAGTYFVSTDGQEALMSVIVIQFITLDGIVSGPDGRAAP